MANIDISAARTNLSSTNVTLHFDQILGQGSFRTCYAGTYIGGNRNKQEAVGKSFKSQYRHLESEFFQTDSEVVAKTIDFANHWNKMCAYDEKIMVNQGSVMNSGHTRYTVEPLIRYFTKFTSNNGWILKDDSWTAEAMEAFSHFTYHRSGGFMIVCDLQGRYRSNSHNKSKSRFELTDPAICSRRRLYGPTDLGEKGIESFFANHKCNQFCNVSGHWQRARVGQKWFQSCPQTSMFQSSATSLLMTSNTTRFNANLQPLYEESDSDY